MIKPLTQYHEHYKNLLKHRTREELLELCARYLTSIAAMEVALGDLDDSEKWEAEEKANYERTVKRTTGSD